MSIVTDSPEGAKSGSSGRQPREGGVNTPGVEPRRGDIRSSSDPTIVDSPGGLDDAGARGEPGFGSRSRGSHPGLTDAAPPGLVKQSPGGDRSGLFSREIDLAPYYRSIRDAVVQFPSRFLVGLGIILRLWEYLQNRSYWLDESSLYGNIKGKGILDFSGTLAGDQLAPFGFLIVQRSMQRIFDYQTYGMRLFPLVSGIMALLLFARLARSTLAPRAALVALALFSLSSDLIYYSAELKQYSTDLAMAILITLVARDLLDRPIDLPSGLRLLGLAIISPWLSFSSAFVVAGAGVTLVFDRLFRKHYQEGATFAAVGAAWAISFGLCYRATHAMLSQYTTMYIFWDFAFLPFPPGDLDSLRKFGGILLDVFVNPLNMVAPIFSGALVVVPVAILLIGFCSLAHRSPALLSLFVLPLVLAIVASALRKYPFHGRLILELVPPFFLLFGEGTEWIRLKTLGRPWISRTALILLLAYPLLSGFFEGLSRSSRDFDSHGDLRHNLFLHENIKK